MALINKYKTLFLLAGVGLAILAGSFSFFYRLYNRDMKALEGFVTSYMNYDRAVSEFSKPLLTLTEWTDRLNKIDASLAASLTSKMLAADRLALARKGISIQPQINDELSSANALEEKAVEALAGLTASTTPLAKVSSLIRNEKQLEPGAREVADNARMEMENLKAFKRKIQDRSERIGKLLQAIVYDHGGTIGYVNVTKQTSNQSDSVNRDPKRLSIEIDELKDHRTTAYAVFLALGPTKD